MTAASVGPAVREACLALRRRIEAGERAPLAAQAEAAPPARSAAGQRLAHRSFGAVFAQVRVDADLGVVRVPRIVATYSVGRLLNRKTGLSQLEGGIVWGIGMALLEHSVPDPRDGRIVNANLAEYHVPVNADVGAIEVAVVDECDTRVQPARRARNRRDRHHRRGRGDRQRRLARHRQAHPRPAHHPRQASLGDGPRFPLGGTAVPPKGKRGPSPFGTIHAMFRSRYLDYAGLMAQVRAWAERHPAFVRLSTLGTTPEGRDIPLLTIGPDPDDGRPAVWVDGNMHASELCGSSAALAIAEDAIALHEGRRQGGAAGLPEHLAAALKEVVFHVVPRISPDGAEAVLRTGRYVRSSPADARRHRGHPYWEGADIDGDGREGYMRVASAEGEMVALEGFPDVMVPRLPEDPPPYYKLYPEGTIANFDGRRIPDPHFLSDNQYDFNRNFPYQWAPEPEQAGAGDYPGSAPETRAILDFAAAHPNLFAWLNFHTFGGVFIRPLGDKPDHKMDPVDLAVYRQVEAWAKELTGYPTVSGYHEFLYEPETPLKGDIVEYAYQQRGAIAYAVELWDIFRRIGVEPKKPFVDHYTKLERKDFLALAQWDRDRNQGRVFGHWRKCRHPQLGEVEVGGLNLLVGISNPPYEELGQVCEQQSGAFLRVAALLPRVTLEVVGRDVLGKNLMRFELRIANRGYLPTYGMGAARRLPHVEPLRLTTRCEGDVQVGAPMQAVQELGHLDGWGQGLFGGGSIFSPWTRGNGHERFVTLVAEGKGRLAVRVGSCRVGYRTLELDVG